jgi:hypothetical protein
MRSLKDIDFFKCFNAPVTIKAFLTIFTFSRECVSRI